MAASTGAKPERCHLKAKLETYMGTTFYVENTEHVHISNKSASNIPAPDSAAAAATENDVQVPNESRKSSTAVKSPKQSSNSPQTAGTAAAAVAEKNKYIIREDSWKGRVYHHVTSRIHAECIHGGEQEGIKDLLDTIRATMFPNAILFKFDTHLKEYVDLADGFIPRELYVGFRVNNAAIILGKLTWKPSSGSVKLFERLSEIPNRLRVRGNLFRATDA